MLIKVSLLDGLLENFLNEAKDLMGALVVDFDGLIISQKSGTGFDEEIIGAIMSVLESTINSIKRFTDVTYGSGTLDTNEFRLFYIELGNNFPALLVIISDPYVDINKYETCSYIVADKLSKILNNKEIDINLPQLNNEGDIILKENNRANLAETITLKVMIIGDTSVGKSSLVSMYINNMFEEEYQPTIGMSFAEKKLQITKHMVLDFNIFDMSGLKNFARTRKSFYNNTDILFIMYDVSDPKSIENLSTWIGEAKHFLEGEDTNFFLIGNKIDLVEDFDELFDKSEEISEKFGMKHYMTSSKTGEGIDEIFMNMMSVANN